MTSVNVFCVLLLVVSAFINTTRANINDSKIFSKEQLLEIRESVFQNHPIRILNPLTCANIRTLGLRKWKKKKEVRVMGSETSPKTKSSTNNEVIENSILIQFLLLNVRSLKANKFIIRDELDTCDIEFAVITETWLKNADQQWTECSQFNNEGYKIITYSRQSRSGGALALIHKDKYVAEELEKGQNKSFEYLICSINIRGITVTLQRTVAEW